MIVQDREGDIYDQFATIPDEKTDLLIRARTNRTLTDKTKLFNCLESNKIEGAYTIAVEGKQNRKKRTAQIEIRYKQVELQKTYGAGKAVASTIKLWLIEAKETGYNGADKICWRLLTTINITDVQTAKGCIEWYS